MLRKLSGDLCSVDAGRRKFFLGTLGLVCVACIDSGASAQNAEEPGELQEVLVTAQRRTENLQSVPLSVQAFDEAALTREGIKDLADLVKRTPGVDLQANLPGNSVISIRGVVPIGGLPTTGLYLDDVPISGVINTNYTGSVDPHIYDMAGVEVLKGPQGTLYGDSAMGGAVKFTFNRPDATSFEGRANAEVASTDDAAGSQEVSGVLNAPMVQDKLALRVSATWRLDGGYLDNVSPYTRRIDGENVNVDRTAAARVALGFTPTDTLTIGLSFLHQRLSAADRSYQTADVPPTRAPSFESTAYLLPLEKQTFQPEPLTDRLDLTTLTIERRFSAMTLTAISGYLTRGHEVDTDPTGYVLGALQRNATVYPAFANTLTTSYNTYETHTFTQEIRLASADTSTRLKWTAGVFYSDWTNEGQQSVLTPGLTKNLAALFGPGVTLHTFLPSALPTDQLFFFASETENREYAAFGEAKYEVTPHVAVSLGARAYDLRQSLESTGEGYFNGGDTSVSPQSDSFRGVNPRFIAEYKFDEEHMLYASASEGFRPGTVNSPVPASSCEHDLAALGRTSAPDGAKPDSLWNYEIGSKNTFFGDRIRANAAAFQMDWSDVQLSVSLPTCGFSFTGNVGSARIRGGEFGFDAQVTQSLALGVQSTYLNAVITNAAPDVQYRAGDELPYTPKQWYAAYGEWRTKSLYSIDVFARADYEWRGNSVRAASVLNNLPNYAYQSWDVVNLNVGAERGKWQVRLFLDNALNKNPTIDFYNLWGQWRTSTLRPRTIGLNLGVKF
jgi:iron complex outermembrane recepter protein